MSRNRRIVLIVAGSLAALIVAGFLALLVVVRTEWFRNTARARIITAVESSTGGRAEIGSFTFDAAHWRAILRNVVIHGREAAAAPPLLRVSMIEAALRPGRPSDYFVGVRYLLIDQPQANVLVYPDGSTNIPSPKVKSASNKSALETIVDLAIDRFDLRKGSVDFADRKTDFDAAGANLRARLAYNANPGYSGEIDINPLYLQSGSNERVEVSVKLPIGLRRDAIALRNAELSTPQSKITLTGSVTRLANPRASGRLDAHISLQEAKRLANLSIPLDTAAAPGVLDATVDGLVNGNDVEIRHALVQLGQSRIQASGALQSPGKPGALQFDGSLATAQLGRLFRVSAKPEGIVRVAGAVKMRPDNKYVVDANLASAGLSLVQNGTRISNVKLAAKVTAVPNRIDVNSIDVSALGGRATGSGAIENMGPFRFNAELHSFDIAILMAAFLPNKKAAYEGEVSGPLHVAGNLKNPSDLTVQANLSIAPPAADPPPAIWGKLNLNYNGRTGSLTIGQSSIQLPHTQVQVSGSLQTGLHLHMTTRDLSDFAPLATLPITLHHGEATVDATITRSLADPLISGRFTMTDFAMAGRQFTRLEAEFTASKSGASVSAGTLTRGPLLARFSGSVGLRDWKLEPNEPLKVDATLRNGEVQDILALAGQPKLPANGPLTADVHISGTVGDPRGAAALAVSNGTLEGHHFDSLTANAVLTQRAVDVSNLRLAAGQSVIRGDATYRHPPNNLKTGTLQVQVAGNRVQLSDFRPVASNQPALQGTLDLNAAASADLRPGPSGVQFQLTAVTGNAAARALAVNGKSLGDLTADARTVASAVQYAVNSNLAGSVIRINGQTGLTGNHATQADARISGLPIVPVLELTGQSLPVSGTLTATAQVSGALAQPRIDASVDVRNGSAYEQHFDRIQADVRYEDRLVNVPALLMVEGPSTVELSASLAHPPGDYLHGQLQFDLRGSRIQLAQIHAAQQLKPGLTGAVELAAKGAATLRGSAAPLFSRLNADLSARSVAVQGKPLGDITASADTRGSALEFRLVSDFARADIRGSGKVQLTADYPVDAQLSFSNVTWSGLSPWTGKPADGFEASAAGAASVAGSLTRLAGLRASVRLTALEAHTLSGLGAVQPRAKFQIRNQGDIFATLERSVLTIRNFNMTGPGTTLAASGFVEFEGARGIDVRTQGSFEMKALEAFSPNYFAAGKITLDAAVTGNLGKTSVNGRVRFDNASFNTVTAPVGVTSANGTISFTGTEAVFQNFTAVVGGGNVTITGAVGYGGPQLQVRLRATANKVRVTYPETITTEVDAKISLEGNTSHSLLSGNVTILNVAMHSRSDIGSILTQAAVPPPTPAPSTGFLGGIRLDVKIQTAPDVQFRTTLTENLQAEATLTLRGSLDHPGMLGRANITSGQVIFFGYQYKVNQGSLTFNNPSRINPTVNIDLETRAQGITVTITVSGPMDRLKLSYRSDPPMEFSDLVALLASGKAPTTDPVLAARQPPPPEQTFTQYGASALLGQAVANPVSGRLGRLFGVSALKISPQITGQTNTPQATLTLKQQITPNLSFTYVQNVTQPNPLGVQMEWSINSQWSAIAQRDEFGIFDLDIFYKRRFR